MTARESAETMALQAMAWLLADPDLCAVFLRDTGLSPSDLPATARSARGLAAVVDFLLADERRVLSFCGAHGLPPDAPLRARAHLPGGNLPNWT